LGNKFFSFCAFAYTRLNSINRVILIFFMALIFCIDDGRINFTYGLHVH
jgi:hypothetical protein